MKMQPTSFVDSDEVEAENEAAPARFDERPSPVFLACWSIVAAIAIAALVPVAYIWRIRPEYNDRFLIPLAGLWIAYSLAEKLRRLPAPGWGAWLGLPILFVGSASFNVAWFLHMQAGAPRIVVWWLLVSALVVIAGAVVFQFGWRHLRLLAFPLAFNFFCLPLPGKLHGPLEMGLKEITTKISARGLPLLGIPTGRHGHVLELPSGQLGVEDACSGIRSFSALMAIACLVAYWRGFSLPRGAILVALTVPIVILANGARVITTGILQEKIGPWIVHGWAHDALGFLVVLVGLGLILLVSQGLRPRLADDPTPEDPTPIQQHLPPAPVSTSLPRPSADDDSEDDDPERRLEWAMSPADWRATMALLVLVPALVGAVVSTFYFRTEPAASVRLADIPTRIGRWNGAAVEVPEFIKEQLVYDRASNYIYRSPTGHEVSAWVVYWSSTDFVPGPHSPDICWPSRGWSVTDSGMQKLVSSKEKTVVNAGFREYAREGREQFLLFWTQENNVVLGVDDWGIEANMGDKRWILDALLRRSTRLRPSKMFVLIGCETWGSKESSRKLLQEFSQDFIDELYRVAPDCQPGVDPATRKPQTPERKSVPIVIEPYQHDR